MPPDLALRLFGHAKVLRWRKDHPVAKTAPWRMSQMPAEKKVSNKKMANIVMAANVLLMYVKAPSMTTKSRPAQYNHHTD